MKKKSVALLLVAALVLISVPLISVMIAKHRSPAKNPNMVVLDMELANLKSIEALHASNRDVIVALEAMKESDYKSAKDNYIAANLKLGEAYTEAYKYLASPNFVEYVFLYFKNNTTRLSIY